MSQVIREEGEREGAPLDPNLVCPMCMKQYRIGEIQLETRLDKISRYLKFTAETAEEEEAVE